MVVRGFRAEVTILDPTRTEVRTIATIDPRAALPQALLNFVLKQIAGLALYLMGVQAKKIPSDPLGHPLAIQIRSNPFYSGYLVPRVFSYYRARGWEPPPIPAFAAVGGWKRKGRRGRRGGHAIEAEEMVHESNKPAATGGSHSKLLKSWRNIYGQTPLRITVGCLVLAYVMYMVIWKRSMLDGMSIWGETNNVN